MPGVVCQRRIVPVAIQLYNNQEISSLLTILYIAHNQQRNFSQIKVRRTTAACIHFTIRTEFHAVHWAMVSLQNFSFLTIHCMDSHPLISRITCDKPILENRMNGSRRRGVWKGQGMSPCPIMPSREDGYERYSFPGRHYQTRCLVGEFH